MNYHFALTTMYVGQAIYSHASMTIYVNQVILHRVWLTSDYAQPTNLIGVTTIDGVVRRVQVMCANVAEIRRFVWMTSHAAVLLCYVMNHAEQVTHHQTNG